MMNKEEIKQCERLKEENEKLIETCKKYSDCLEEIKAYCKSCEYGLDAQKIINYIDEILESEEE